MVLPFASGEDITAAAANIPISMASQLLSVAEHSHLSAGWSGQVRTQRAQLFTGILLVAGIE